jgi:hypothetical protein
VSGLRRSVLGIQSRWSRLQVWLCPLALGFVMRSQHGRPPGCGFRESWSHAHVEVRRWADSRY